MNDGDDKVSVGLYKLPHETKLAKCFSESPDGSESFWIPNSMITAIDVYIPAAGKLPECDLEIPRWKARELELDED